MDRLKRLTGLFVLLLPAAAVAEPKAPPPENPALDIRIRPAAKYDFFAFLNALSDDATLSRAYETERRAWLPEIQNHPDALKSLLLWRGHGIALAYLFSASPKPLAALPGELRRPDSFYRAVKEYMDEPAYEKEFARMKENRASLIVLLDYFQAAGFEKHWRANFEAALLQKSVLLRDALASKLGISSLQTVARFTSSKFNPRAPLPDIYVTYFGKPYNFTLTQGRICLKSDLNPAEAPAAVLHEWLHRFNPDSNVLELQEGVRGRNPFYAAAWTRIYDTGKEGREEEFVMAAELYTSVLSGIRSPTEALRYVKSTYGGLPLAGLLYERLRTAYPSGLPDAFDYNVFLSSALKSAPFAPDRMQDAFRELIAPVSGIAGMRLELTKEGPRIVQVFDGFPAKQAGLDAGDTIVRINGASTSSLPLAGVLDILSGKPGDSFDLAVRGHDSKQVRLVLGNGGRPRVDPSKSPVAASAKDDLEFWDGPAMRTPFRENLSDDEKVAGLSKLWAEAKFNFIYFDKASALNWDGVYMEYLPKVRATKSTLEYYRLLKEMYARLADGHTGVEMPKELMDEAAARPLLRTALVEGKVMIVAVAGRLAAPGLAPGLEIVEIDGLAAAEYAKRYVAPYQSASTPQDRDARVYGAALLDGALGRPVTLALRDASGKTVTLSVPRVSDSDYWYALGRGPMSFKMLPGNVAYAALNSFHDGKAADMFEAAFPKIARADALVLDLRENDGGSSGVGYRVLACLTDKAFFGSKWETRDYRPALRARGQGETRFGGPPDRVAPNGKLLFTKPVVVLTSPRTYSAAEDFIVAFRGMKRGAVVGEATGGSTGQPLWFPLPGGGDAHVCTKHDAFADGTEFVGVGIKPDVAVGPTVADLRAGRDTVLAAALRVLDPGRPQ